MAQKTVFIYPEMLPVCALKQRNPASYEPEKPFFADAEDNLIVLGLEEFYKGGNTWKNEKGICKNLTEACTFIGKLQHISTLDVLQNDCIFVLAASIKMRAKTVKHIRCRIKNRKDLHKTKDENPIKFYFRNSFAPREAFNSLSMTYNFTRLFFIPLLS